MRCDRRGSCALFKKIGRFRQHIQRVRIKHQGCFYASDQIGEDLTPLVRNIHPVPEEHGVCPRDRFVKISGIKGKFAFKRRHSQERTFRDLIHHGIEDTIGHAEFHKSVPKCESRRAEFCPAVWGENDEELYYTTSNDKVTGDETSDITGTKYSDIWVTRRDENGNLDYETVEAVDRDRLAADMNALFAGEAVHLRKFDFRRHDGYDDDHETKLESDGVIVLEGIHALNPALTSGIDDVLKFRVYLNALTQLVVDSCNRISTTDTRLIRRLVRDFNYRGMSPLETFRLWPNVAAGERKWIYPYQRHADAVFNSALDYELAVLKPFALQLLNQVKPWHREYLEARRLSGILHNVSLAVPDAVPGDSILRESIGGSQLAY